jgi:conjugative relaxase-like TrwC/TraI family protein
MIRARPISAKRFGATIAYFFAYLTSPDIWQRAPFWHGKAIAQAGLSSGPAAEDDARAIFSGFSSDGTPVVQNAGKANHQPGVELVFACVKSLSALWACAGENLRMAIEEIILAAVLAVIDLVESELEIRLGKGGHIRERACAGVSLLKPEYLSRAGEPSLHVHAWIASLGLGTDGTFRAVNRSKILANTMRYGALFRAELAKRLEDRLGLSIVRTKDAFEIVGVPDSLCQRWSTRSNLMVKALGGGPREIHSDHAKTSAALLTKPAKEKYVPELHKEWTQEALRHGFSAEGLRPRAPHRENIEKLKAGLVSDAIEKLSATRAAFTAGDLEKQLALSAIETGIGMADILKLSEIVLRQSTAIVPLGKKYGEFIYTTRPTLEQEKELLRLVEETRQDTRFMVSEKRLQKSIASVERQLTREARRLDPLSLPFSFSAEQRAALHDFCCKPGRLKVLQGVPGAGKTKLLRVLKDLYSRQGIAPIAASIVKRAALHLEETSGIKAQTIASLERDLSHSAADTAKHHARQIVRAAQGKKTFRERPRTRLSSDKFLVLEEASMLSTEAWTNILKKSHGCAILAIGDSRQLPNISGNAAPFRHLAEVLRAPTLSTNQRQQRSVDREVTQLFGQGEAQKAFEKIKLDNRLFESPTRTKAMEAMVTKWVELGGAARAKDYLLLAPTNVEVDRLNALASEAIRKTKIKPPRSIEHDGLTFHVGDRVTFTQNAAHLNPDFVNRLTGTLTKINSKRDRIITIRLDNGKDVTVPLQLYPHIRLGFASTIYASQGLSCRSALILCGGYSSREAIHVAASRHRDQGLFFSDRFEMEDLPRFYKSHSRSIHRPLAHEVRNDIQQHQTRGSL